MSNKFFKNSDTGDLYRFSSDGSVFSKKTLDSAETEPKSGNESMGKANDAIRFGEAIERKEYGDY